MAQAVAAAGAPADARRANPDARNGLSSHSSTVARADRTESTRARVDARAAFILLSLITRGDSSSKDQSALRTTQMLRPVTYSLGISAPAGE